MKILELTRQYYPSIGGMEKFVEDRLKVFEKLGHSYQVVATDHMERNLNNNNKLADVVYLKGYTPYGIVPCLRKIFDIEFDVLSLNKIGYYYSDYAILEAFNRGKRIILTPHMYFHTDRFKLIKAIHYKWVLPRILKKVDKIICFTSYEANFWLKNFSFVSNKIEIIPHYFESSFNKDINTPIYTGKYLLYLGRGGKNKRIDLLIPAFNKIDSKYNLVLTIDYDELSKVNRQIVQSNENIHILGRVSEIKKQNLLNHCSALILPTDYEAFGIVNFEASYYKKALLLSNLEVFQCYLKRNGVIYFENNIESIKNAIQFFYSLNSKEVKQMGIENSNNLKQFTLNEISQKYLYLFESLKN